MERKRKSVEESTGLRFRDFVEKCYGAFRRGEFSNGSISVVHVGGLERSHIFYLGEDIEYQESINEVQAELVEEMSDGVPMPFDDVSTVSVVRSRTKELGPVEKAVADEFGLGVDDGIWLLDRIVRVKGDYPPNIDFDEMRKLDRTSDGIPVVDKFLLYRLYGVGGRKVVSLSFPFAFGGSGIDDKGKPYSRIVMANNSVVMANEMTAILEQVTAISHPSNYVVRVQPKMSPREIRRKSAGKHIADSKRPHFIVVDHQVLVSMRRGDGTHASPVPHERRGHWRRLAERFKKARLLKGERTFVRPALVGGATWGDQKNLYEVLPPDFSKGEQG